jgi:hypothetical protein
MAHPIRFLAPFLLAPALAVGVLSYAAPASAGDLTLRDEAHVFSPGDADELRATIARSPFDARLVTTTAYADQPSFSRYVGSLVSEPDMVVVGIDPTHRHVQVHFGTGSHIPQAAWPGIERAGNDAFHRGAWEEGSAAIFRAAASSVTSTGGSTSPAASPSSQGTSFLGPLMLLLIVGGVIAVIVLFARRRAQYYQGGPGTYGGGPYPGGPGPYQGGGPYYGPGAPPGGGMGALGGGLIGAGLGGLAGYELGKMEGEREERTREQGGFGSFDAGDSSSSSNDGSYDAGGGGSSWDGGGGDGGGGGFDGGGDGGGGDGGDGGGGGSDF